MATVSTPKMTAEEFFHWMNRPENAGVRFELFRGEPLRLVSWPPGSERHYHQLVGLLTDYVMGQKIGCVAIVGDGLITRRNPDTVRCPTAMLFLRPEPLDDFPPRYTTEAPHLVLELCPPGDSFGRIMRRVTEYVSLGVPLVWLVEPDDRPVSIYRPERSPYVAEADDELTGNGVLPDFRCRVADLFALPGQPPAPPSP